MSNHPLLFTRWIEYDEFCKLSYFLGERSIAELTSRSSRAAATTENLPIEDSIVKVSPGLDIIPSRIENAVLDNYLMLNYKQPPKKEAALLN